LHLVSLSESTLEGMLAWLVSIAVQATLVVGIFAAGIGATFADPSDHATAAEAIAAFTLGKAVPFVVKVRVAAGAVSEDLVGALLRSSMDGVESVTVSTAGLVGVLGFAAVEACLVATFFIDGNPAIRLAAEGLQCRFLTGAAVHAFHSDFELLLVPEWQLSVRFLSHENARGRHACVRRAVVIF
jgi:hypothetical protein